MIDDISVFQPLSLNFGDVSDHLNTFSVSKRASEH